MLHRHVTLERYELALEEDGIRAARLRSRAERCPTCLAALVEPQLAPVLAAWRPPASVDSPVPWEAALRRAVAPSAAQRRPAWSGARRLVAVAALLAGLLLATALPAAASTGPSSALFPVRGVEEDVRWRLTPEQDRATLEADLASTYLWQARTSAARHDDRGYRAAMQRFFTWAGRLQADIRSAPPAQRSTARDVVSADMSVASPLATSGPDPAEGRRAESIIGEVEAESDRGEGQHNGGRQPDPGAPGQRSAPASTPEGREGSPAGDGGQWGQSSQGSSPPEL